MKQAVCIASAVLALCLLVNVSPRADFWYGIDGPVTLNIDSTKVAIQFEGGIGEDNEATVLAMFPRIQSLRPDAEAFTGFLVCSLSVAAGYDTFLPTFDGPIATYQVPTVAGDVTSGCCGVYTGGYTGNTDCDIEGKRNLSGITKLIDRVYLSKSPLCCEANGNVDGDSEDKLNLSDITKLIDHVYLSKQPTAPCV